MKENLSRWPSFWPMLALDHGLTDHSQAIRLSEIESLLVGCQHYVGSVVMNYGVMRQFSEIAPDLPRVLQCFGSPAGCPKIQIANVEQALRLNAKGVAVQIDFGLPSGDLANQIESISEIVGYAHQANIPVLFMVSSTSFIDEDGFMRSIRACMEMGADLIKARPLNNELRSAMISDEARALIAMSPPILLAGGEENGSILEIVKDAKNAGFSGYCIGRNIFQSNNPTSMTESIFKSWYNKY